MPPKVSFFDLSGAFLIFLIRVSSRMPVRNKGGAENRLRVLLADLLFDFL